MKRWQDRGEVEDSEDDEELSLELESPEHERPWKRPKLDHGSGAVQSENIAPCPIHSERPFTVQDDDDDDGWAATKVAKTYGRRARTKVAAASPAGLALPGGEPDALEAVTEITPAQNSSEGHLAQSASPNVNLRLSAQILPTARQDGGAASRNEFLLQRGRLGSPVRTVAPLQLKSTALRKIPRKQLQHDISERSRSSPEDEPQLAEDVSGNPDDPKSSTEASIQVSTNEHEFPHIDDLVSSPLSEREVSPPADFLQRGRDREMDDALVDRDLDVEADARSPHSAANARRNFRTRKEVQLHPYMFDKAQYQKQFRERGLKPIRLIEQDIPNEETQSASHSDGSQPAIASSAASTQSMIAEPIGANQQADFNTDFFDFHVSSSEDGSGLEPAQNQRRKLNFVKHKTNPSFDAVDQSRPSSSGAADLGIPPSPPVTSSDASTPSHEQSSTGQPSSRLRLPRSHTPVPLPTPHVSSDAKGAGSGRRSRTEPRELPVPSSPEASSSEDDADVKAAIEARRLRREQKRIKGVLPASWLRIDFRNQTRQESLSPPRRRLSTASPPKSEPRKGVARRLTTARSRSPGSQKLREEGIDNPDSEASVEEVGGPAYRSAGIDNTRNILAYGGRVVDEDDDMENDFVDPMLAGNGFTQRRAPKDQRRKQPLITQAFHKTPRDHTAFSNERPAHKSVRTGLGSHRGAQRKRQPDSNRAYARASRLSIADAPISSSATTTDLPQFVRLALRRTRKSLDQGRHSPTYKFVRLATAEDTKEAASVLHAWRNGSLTPRQPSPNATRRVPASSVDHQRSTFPDMMGHLSLPPDAPSRSLVSRPPGKRRPMVRQMRINDHAFGDSTPANAPTTAARSHPRPRVPRQSNLPRLRGGQLETLESDFISAHRSAAFGNRMHHLTETTALPEDRIVTSGFHLARFLGEGDETSGPLRTGPLTQLNEATGGTIMDVEQVAQRLPHRKRKALARRINADAREYRQPSEPLPDIVATTESAQPMPNVVGEVLQGLGSFGTRYPVDFDIRPMPAGTLFQHTTFIGSGEFNDALKLSQRDLSHDVGRIHVRIGVQIHEWGPWTEDVAAQFARIPQVVDDALSELYRLEPDKRDQERAVIDRNVDYLLRSVMRYCSKCLWFLDVVDRQSCVQSLCCLVAHLTDVLGQRVGASAPLPQTITRIAQYQLVIAKLACQLSDHSVVGPDIKKDADQLLSRTSLHLARTGVMGQFRDLRNCYEHIRSDPIHAAGIDGEAWTLSSCVILSHVVRDGHRSKALFWETIFTAMDINVSQTCAVQEFETVWYSIFTLLPALEFDAMGIVRVGSRLTSSQDGWSLPQRLISRVFELYETSSNVRGYSVNEYMRAILQRCHHLVSGWGWWRCESVVTLIYDFFSRRGLSLLNKEESRGSPKFLNLLGTQEVTLEVQSDDNSFHMFLKILATGLLGMHKYQIYPDRKTQGFAWRFIPNHNRTYRKDVDVERAALDSLRNHHDLLCTLYFALPSGHRPGVHLLRALVDHTSSHREACRLNVRSWAHLASYQVSTSESRSEVLPLTSWYTDVVAATMAQYRLAKSEAQSDFIRAKEEGAKPSETLLETTVANNQRQIAATLVDALAGLKRAVSSASSLAMAMSLVEGTAFWDVFELFDPNQRRLISSMKEGLDVVSAALDAERKFGNNSISQSFSEDSQEFGDFSALQEFATNDEAHGGTCSSLAGILLSPVGKFVSNVLGADVAPDDSLLQHVVDVWVRVASMTVKKLGKHWLSYLDEYSATGWAQMRDTAQKRKFTAYFISRVVELSENDNEVRQHVLTAWLQSMVEREALLKFQHVLTSALLNHRAHDPLLENLPFAKDTTSGLYNISIAEIRQRRLALISAVLCNMRQTYEGVERKRVDSFQEARRMHIAMLQRVMQTMKSNYGELQTSRARPSSEDSGQGAYVEFVQQVVSFLQQHTADICPVDRFFTDSGAFPLPVDDPTYVIGKLRRYVPKLGDPGTRKALAVFVHTVVERAVLEQQQQYLVNQMAIAVKGVLEYGNVQRPTLRQVLLTSIFPAYIENALQTAHSWIPLMPILQACQRIVPELLYSIQIQDERSVLAVIDSMMAVLQSINRECHRILVGIKEWVDLPHVLKTLCTMVAVGTSSFTVISYIARATSLGSELKEEMHYLRKMLSMVEARLRGSGEVDVFVPPLPLPHDFEYTWQDTRDYVEKQVEEPQVPTWRNREGSYEIRRNGSWKEVVVDLQSIASERASLLKEVEEFGRSYHATFSIRSRRTRMISGHASGSSVVAVTLTFIFLATVFVLSRIYARFRIARNPGLDDVFISLSLLFSAGTTTTFIIQVFNGGGQHMGTITPTEGIRQGKAFYASVILYNASLLMSKLSILLQYLRIFPQKGFRVVCYVVLGIVAAYATFAILTAIFACNPIRSFWDQSVQGTCLPRFPIWFANSAFNIISDIAIALIPMPLLDKLGMPKNTKRALQLVFLLGGCGCIVSILRFQSLYVISRSSDVSYDNPMAAIWSDIEMNIAIMCSCLPTLRCMFPRLLKNHISVPRSGSHGMPGTAPRSGAGSNTGMASAMAKLSSKNASAKSASSHSSDDSTNQIHVIGQKQDSRGTTWSATSNIRTMSSFDDIELGRVSHNLQNGRIHVMTAIEQEVEKREEGEGVMSDTDSTTGLTRNSKASLYRDGRCEGA
ncbi:unnamed protein product [Zymoseptoria tritici ST99CH_3D1]|nr:unnamed protein product [Zymoseptoria tritici ST99CH_3D1]